MSNETEQQQLWTDERIEEETERHWKAHGETYQYLWVREMMRQIRDDCLADRAALRAQVAALKQQLSVCSEYADKVTAERDAAREWQPVIYSTFIEDQSYDESYLLVTLQGTQLEIGRDPTADGVTVNLPSDYRLCQRKEKGAA